jgi:hypothetical protein
MQVEPQRWWPVSRHFLSPLSFFAVPAITAILPTYGYALPAILTGCAITLLLIWHRLHKAEKNRQFSRTRRRIIAAVYAIFVLVGGTYMALIGKAADDIAHATISRSEFLQLQNRPVEQAGFVIELDKPMTREELGHFRLVMELVDRRLHDPIHFKKYAACLQKGVLPGRGNCEDLAMWFAAMDGGVEFPTPDELREEFLAWDRHGTYGSGAPAFTGWAWSNGTDDSWRGIAGQRMVEPNDQPIQHIAFNVPMENSPFHKMGDFDKWGIDFYVTKSLAPHIRNVAFLVDEYLLLRLPASEWKTIERAPWRGRPEWWRLSPEQEKEPWAMFTLPGMTVWAPPVLYNDLPLQLDFSRYTPVRAEKVLSNSKIMVPPPNYFD